MAERRTHPNGGVYERGADGQWHLVSQSPAMGPAIGNDPRIPGALQGQALSNQNTGVNVRVNAATEGAQIREATAKANKAEAEAGVVGVNPAFDREKDLRSSFEAQPAVQAYKDAASSLGIMLQTPDTGGGDIQIIYNYIKSQGPGPVAQGELDLAQSVASFREGLEQKYGKLTSSNRLPKRVRRELIEASRQAVAVKRAQFDQVYEQFRTDAARNGLDPQSVTGRHPADAVRPAEEKYIRQHGQTPHSAKTGEPIRGIAAAAPNAEAVTRLNPERSAFIDAMVRNGVPFERAQEAYRQQFPGVPVFDNRAKWNEALSFARKHPSAAGSFGESMDTVPLSDRQQANAAFVRSAPGQVATLGLNALTGGIPTILAGEQGNLSVDSAREGLGTAGSLGVEVPGAIAGTFLGSRGIGAGAKLLKQGVNPTTQMLAADLGYGALFGAAEGGPDNRLGGAALGAGVAGLGNQIGSRVLAPGLRAGGSMLGINPAPALNRADDMIASQTMKANPADVMGRMQEAVDLRMPFTLADADPRLRSLGGSVVRKSPDAFADAQSAIGSRTLGQVDRLTGIVEGEMGPRLNLPTFKEGVKKSAQSASRSLYESAKAQPPVDDALINEMLQTPAGQRAARSGYDEAINNGESVGDLVEEVDSINGQLRLVGRPSWHVLQRMKFALDAMPDQESLARRFNSRLGALNSDFRKANLEYAKQMRRGDIAEGGYGAASPNIKPPELGASMGAPRNMKDPALFRQGYGSNLVDKARGMRDSANPYEVASIASPDQLAKMEMISPSLSSRFGRARGIETEMAATNRELFGGSPTQPRAEADKLFEGGVMDAVGGGLLDVAAGTPPINAMRAGLFAGRSGFSGLKDAYKLGSLRGAKQRADELAPLLFNPDAEANLALLSDIVAAKRAREAYVQKTGLFGSGIGAPLAIGYSANR